MATVTLDDSPVPYDVLYSPAATLSGESSSGYEAQLGFSVADEDLDQFVAFCGGLPQTITTTGGDITRYVPLSHPRYPNLLCQAIRTSGTGYWTEERGNWSHHRVLCTFRPVSYATDGSEPFLTKRTRASAEVYTIAGTNMAFTDGRPIQADAGITVPTLSYTYMFHNCQSLDDDLVASLLGKVSSSTFLGKPAGTMRFDSMNAEETFTAGMNLTFNRELIVTYRPIDWNKFLTPDATWDYAEKPDGSYAYETADLNPLFS